MREGKKYKLQGEVCCVAKLRPRGKECFCESEGLVEVER